MRCTSLIRQKIFFLRREAEKIALFPTFRLNNPQIFFSFVKNKIPFFYEATPFGREQLYPKPIYSRTSGRSHTG
jgi:hypothetical protein